VGIWDARSGAPLDTLAGDGAEQATVDFSPDGTRLVAGGADKMARVWDVHRETRTPEAIAAVLAERVPWRLDGAHLVPTSDNRSK
jgi:WD40 repeat protein